MKTSLRFLFMLIITLISIELIAQTTTKPGASLMQMSKSDLQEEDAGDNFQLQPAKTRQVRPFMAATTTMAVTGDTATGITFYSVILQASADAEGIPTAVRFEFGTDTTYGYMVVPEPDTITGTGMVSFHADVVGIAAGTTYHFRVRTENGSGVFYGPDHLFSTLAAPANNFTFTPARMTNQILAWTDLGTTGTAIAFDNYDDAHSLPVNIGFDFDYSGVTFSQFVINTNGFIKLGNIHPADSVQFFDSPRGTPTGPVGNMNGIFKSQHFADVYLISPFNHDLQPGTNSPEIRVLTEGDPGNRVCTIQFKNFQDKIQPPDRQYNNMQFQIKLHESGVVDFVWGTWEPSSNLSFWRAAAVGLKGSTAAENEMLTITKSSNATWQVIVPRIGNYCTTCNAFNFGNPTRPQPEAGRTYTFYPKLHQDATVKEIYTLGKLPIPYGLPHVVKAYVKNSGLDTLANIPVSLNITGANPFTANGIIPMLKPDSGKVVEFPGFVPTLQGFNTLTVTLPADQFSFDNTKSFPQEITKDKYAYCDTNGYGYCIGNIYVPGPGSPSGEWLSKFHVNGKKNITEARIGLGTGEGQSVYAVLLNSYGYKIAQSPNLTLSSANTWKPYTFEFYNPPVIENSDFYIGLMQTQSTQTYFPMGIQVEDPQRRGAYYTSNTNGILNENYSSNYRFVVEATFDTGYCFAHFNATASCQPGGIALITAFSTTEGVTNIHDTIAICNGNPGNYTFYPGQVITAEQGTSFNFSASANDNLVYDLYADWNDDGDFYDPSELVFSSNWTTPACCITGIAGIPASAAVGNTRLRFMGRPKWYSSPDPCGDFGYGETRDYTLAILPATTMNIEQSTTFQCDTTIIVSRNATDVPVIGIKMKAGGALNPLAVSAFSLSAAGCSNFSNDVTMAHLYFTGNDPVFSTSHLFGSVSNLNFPITGLDTLKNGWNYFWLTFDISENATIGDFLDAGCIDFFVENEGNYTPSVSFPPGKLTIDYCIPEFSDKQGCLNNGYGISSFTTTGGITNISNLNSGCPVNNTDYSYFQEQSVTVEQGYPFRFDASSEQWIYFQIFADWNQDADFDDPGELASNTWGYQTTGTIVVPWWAETGTTRMRVIGFWSQEYPGANGNKSPLDNGCPFIWGWGETEDYNLTVLPGSPMTWQSGTTSQCDTLQSATRGKTDVPVIGIKIATAGGMSPFTLTSLNLGVAATTDFTHDVFSAKVYFTGNDSVFSSTVPGQLYGSSTNLANPVIGNINLYPGNNYFWVTYDIADTATVGHFIDASCLSYVLTGSGTHVPTVTSPPGRLMINYCIPTFTYTGGCDYGAGISGFSTTGGAVNISNLNNGCPNNPYSYTFFSNHNLSAEQGNPFQFSITGRGLPLTFTLFADWNGDFDFDEPDEMISDSYGNLTSGNVVVPINAVPGTTRLRVIGWYDDSNMKSPKQAMPAGCQDYTGRGETEDYILTILPATPMVLQSASATQCDTLPPATRGSLNNPIIRIRMNAMGALTPGSVTSFTIGSAGSTNFQHDVSLVKIFYTGSDSVFSTAQLFGSVTNLSSPVTGNKQLQTGKNFFWITFNVRDTATIGHYLDATCTGFMLGSNPYTPTVTNPAGHQIIDYCIPSFRSPGDCINGYGTDDFSTTGGISNISNLNNGCPANLFDYSKFTDKTVTAQQGSTFQVHLKSMGSEPDFYIYIDWNHNYWFDADENYYIGYGFIVDGTISIPSNALTGPTRLRVISSWEEGMSPTFQNECFFIRGGGEVEDYTINVVTAVPATTNIQNVTVPAGHDTCFNATQIITVAGNGTSFMVQGGGSADLIAGQKIIFKPVSKVLSGGYLHAWIATGSNYCNLVTMPVMTAVNDQDVPDSEFEPAGNGILSGVSFSVYPNPASGYFTVGFREKPADRQARIQCYNMLGSEIIDQFIDTDTRHEFSFTDKQPGVYLLKVTVNGEVHTRKIVKN